MDLEDLVRDLTQPCLGQYPRPWTWRKSKCFQHPKDSRVFIVGYNQATILPVDLIDQRKGGYDGYVKALFNSGEESIVELVEEMRAGKKHSRTRRNTEKLSRYLAEHQITGIIETNVFCFGAPKTKELKKNKIGMARGRVIFKEIVGKIRPKILIVHGKATAEELQKSFFPKIAFPKLAWKDEDDVSSECIPMQSIDPLYKPLVVPFPSLSFYYFDEWRKKCPSHLDKISEKVRDF